MSDTPLTDASKHAHIAVKVDGHGRPVADADVDLFQLPAVRRLARRAETRE